MQRTYQLALRTGCSALVPVAVTDGFTLTRGAANQQPTANFTVTPTGLTAAFDATSSSDDGTITGFPWNFGASTTGSGITTSHTDAAAGTYTATLTVTDNGGLTGTVSKPVTVTSPGGSTPFIVDNFGRTVATGFGTADLGGPWTVVGAATNYSVSGGAGLLRMAAGGTRPAYLASTISSDADLRLTLSMDKVATGSGIYADILGRRISATDDYRARMRFNAAGTVTLTLAALKGTSSVTAIGSGMTIPGLTYTAGQQLEMRVQVTGTNPTTIRARVWPTGSTGPVTWQATATDSFASLQVAGACGVAPYLSSTATNAPVTAWIDNLTVGPTA